MKSYPIPVYTPEPGYFYALEAKSARWDGEIIRPTVAMKEWLATCEGDWLLTRSDYIQPFARHTRAYKMGTWDGRGYQINFVSARDAALFKMFFL